MGRFGFREGPLRLILNFDRGSVDKEGTSVLQQRVRESARLGSVPLVSLQVVVKFWSTNHKCGKSQHQTLIDAQNQSKKKDVTFRGKNPTLCCL